MSAEATNVEAMQYVYTCDAPRCSQRFGVVRSPELWKAGVETAPDALPDTWAEFGLADGDRRSIGRVVLCPDHADLAEHRTLIELVLGIVGIKAPEREDADTSVS